MKNTRGAINDLREILTEQENELEPITVWRKAKHRFRQPSKPGSGDDLSENAHGRAADEPKRQLSESNDAETAVTISGDAPLGGLDALHQLLLGSGGLKARFNSPQRWRMDAIA
ncbi:MAG: hypothetical protein ACLPTZ_24020, partial [Beijerinckiaceae bacterium]